MGALVDMSLVETLLSDPFCFTDECLMESSSSEGEEEEEPSGASTPDQQTILDVSDHGFHDRFHVGKTVYTTLVGLLEDGTGFSGCVRTPPGLTAAILLRYLRTVDRTVQIAHEFGLNIQCTESIIAHAAKTVAGSIGRFVQWPTLERSHKSSRSFYEVSRIEGAIGSIEVSHVEVEPPAERLEEYVNAAGWTSVAVQGIVSFDCKFLDVFLSEGSDDPYRILEKSCVDFDDMQEHFLVGNHQSYRRCESIVTPFPDGEKPTWSHEKFNKNLEIVYSRSLKAFGYLKGRFPRLGTRIVGGVSFASDVVRAACVLHNLCADVEECRYFVKDAGVPRPISTEPRRSGGDGLRERVFTSFVQVCPD